MTVEELIEKLEKVEDKSMDVLRDIEWTNVRIVEVYVNSIRTPPVVIIT